MKREELDNRLSEIEGELLGVERTTDTRIYLPCESEHVYRVCEFLFDELKLRFVISTGLDAEHCFEVLHHFTDDEIDLLSCEKVANFRAALCTINQTAWNDFIAHRFEFLGMAFDMG